MSYNHGRNPYIIGTPIEIPDRLFGRDSLFNQIRDNLQNDAKFILLHGQRRIGKSSVLNILPFVIAGDEFLFVSYDLQNDIRSENNQILHSIISRILQRLRIDEDINYLLEPNGNLEDRRIRRTILNIGYELHIKKLKLVLLLDEFDVTQNDTDKAVKFLEYLNNLIKNEKELYLIAVVGRYLNSMPHLLQVFRGAPFLEIGFLNNDDAQKLIMEPARDSLRYREESIAKILNFSSGHPLYTQVLCYEIFNLARTETNGGNCTIVPDDVDTIILQALESSDAGCGCFWDGLSTHEKVVISTVAQAQEENIIGNPAQTLEAYGLVLTDALAEAIDELIKRGFLDSNPIKIKVELVRLWLLKHHKFRDEIRSLEGIESEGININTILKVARSFGGPRDPEQRALKYYEDALKLNPNHFITIVELAEKYWDLKYFDKAVELYERAYKLDKLGHKQKFIEVLDKYGDHLCEQGDNEKAKEQYEKILQIESENASAQDKVKKLIDPQETNSESGASAKILDDPNPNFTQWLQRITQPNFWIIAGSLIAVFVIIFIFINRNKDCTVDQQKDSRGVCIPKPPSTIPGDANPESLSSGDRTLFSQIKTNKPQDIQKFKESKQKGITSFQQKKYKGAEEYFKEAVKYNSNDPEVLIYQNNSLARQKEQPFVLAVAVPTRHQSNYVLAWEILRGIAQAQDGFNKNNRLNGRLLEIIIADDGDSRVQAKKVAEQIVENKSILGVIGHNASGITSEALQIYEKVRIPIISSTSTSTTLQSSVFFRTLPSDRETGKKLAKYAIKKGLKKVLVLCNPDERYSSSIKEEFRINLVQSGGEVIGDACINVANNNVESDILNSLSTIKQIQAIAIFPDTQHLDKAIEIAKKYKTIKSGISLLGGDSVYVEDIFQKGGNDIEGLVLAVPWFRETKKSQKFAQNAKKQWGGDVSWRTATSDDAVKAFIDSINKSISSSQTPSRNTVLDNLKNVEVKETSFGEPLRFNERHESQREAILVRVKNGKFESEEE